MICPQCGSENVRIETVQENAGTTTVSKTKSRYRERGHGLIWWLTIGWWWWAVDLSLWVFAFVPRLIIRLFAAPFRRRRYSGTSRTIETTVNHIHYRTVCTCQMCGYSWIRDAEMQNEQRNGAFAGSLQNTAGRLTDGAVNTLNAFSDRLRRSENTDGQEPEMIETEEYSDTDGNNN